MVHEEEDIDRRGRGARFLAVILALLDDVGLGESDRRPPDVIKQRQDNRKEAGATMRAIKGVIDAKGDVKTIVPQAAKLKTLEAAFIKMFPAGSDKGDTKALPTVWSDSAGFAAASK